MVADLTRTLQPVGAIELALLERIATNIWRQRRLVAAETEAIELNQRDTRVARELERLRERSIGSDIEPSDLHEFDREHETWCQAVIEEVDALEVITLESIGANAPLTLEQLESDASEDNETIEEHVEDYENGVSGYVSRLYGWCSNELIEAKRRPELLRFASQVRSRQLVLPQDQLELFARYQTTLDNQLYKALRTFREAQEWRFKSIDSACVEPSAKSPLTPVG